MDKPKWMMEDLEVSFVSLVNKGANKQRFAIYKSDASTENVSKDGCCSVDEYPQPYAPLMPSSFADAVSAKETEESLKEAKESLDEYFWILKCVMNGIVTDMNISNKTVAMKKAIDEFKSATVDLFKQMSVQKQAEIKLGGGDMGIENNTAPSADTTVPTGVSKGAAAGGVSQEPQPPANNRPSGGPDKVEGVTMANGKKMTKAEAIAEIEKKKQSQAEWAAEQKKKEEAMKKEAIELAELEQAIAKAGAEATTGRDGIASNGAEGTVAPTHGSSVQKDGVADVGAANPAATPSQALRQDVSLEGSIGPVVESFKKHFDVSLNGILGTMTDLLKAQKLEVEKMINDKVGTIQGQVTTLRKSSGLSNSGDLDFDTESEKKRDEVAKGDDKEWGNVLDGFGSFRRAKR